MPFRRGGRVLEVEDLHKRYGDVVALDGLSLQARPGRLLGFLGPNGAGKTTTMRAVFGLVRLDAGTVRWHGAPVTADRRRRFGYLPEQRGLYPRMPLARQLTYLARLHGAGRSAAAAAATRWLVELGLGDRADDRVAQLSHGNQQRVQLAAALAHDPELLVLDEPFSGLDPLGVESMSAVLRDRARDGATVVFSSHQLDLVEDLCDDVLIIAHGRDQLAGSLEEVRATAGYRRAEIRLHGGARVAVPDGVELLGTRDGIVQLRVPRDSDPRTLLDRLAGDHGVERFRLEPPSLTEIFRGTVGRTVAELEAQPGSEAAT